MRLLSVQVRGRLSVHVRGRLSVQVRGRLSVHVKGRLSVHVKGLLRVHESDPGREAGATAEGGDVPPGLDGGSGL